MAATTINLDKLQQMFGLPDFDSIEEMNESYIYESGNEDEAREELFRKWHDAVEGVAEKLFYQHGLELDPLRAKERTPFEYKLVPKKNWDDVARHLIQTINGVGDFHFANLREFLDVGPYNSARAAVVAHLGYVASRPEVYGETRPRRMFEQMWR